jgi:PTH2 family peptidyl-tRNA hydrolase
MHPINPNYMYKQVIVMRRDLGMRTGKMIAQGAHASMVAIIHNNHDDRVKNWISTRFAKIVVYVKSEEELLELHMQAKMRGMISHLITDAGFTEFNGVATNTCIAIGPDLVENFDGLTDKLPLL